MADGTPRWQATGPMSRNGRTSDARRRLARTVKQAHVKPRGFALVVTLSLMILLTVVAVGLLGLSAVSMRAVAQAKAESEARANARLALMIAIGELQKQMGPDQRISANGAITDPDVLKIKNPHWTGVWDSWKAGPDKSGNDATSEHSTIANASNSGMAPTYQTNRTDHFRAWLLSLEPGEAAKIDNARTLALNGVKMPAGNANSAAVHLVADGSLGKSAAATDFVSAITPAFAAL